MIKISNNVTIKQMIEVTDKKTNKTSYLVMDDDNKEWRSITQEEYNNIRGYNNGE